MHLAALWYDDGFNDYPAAHTTDTDVDILHIMVVTTVLYAMNVWISSSPDFTLGFSMPN